MPSARLPKRLRLRCMLDHVSITVTDLARAAVFYDAIMHALGYPCVYRLEDAIGYGLRNTPEDNSHSYLTIAVDVAPSGGRRHWALRAPDRPSVIAFHQAALRSGGRDDGAPAPRPASTTATSRPSSKILTAIA